MPEPEMIDMSLHSLVGHVLEREEFKYALIAAANDWRKMANALESVPSHEGDGYDATYVENLMLHGTRGAINNALFDTVVQLARSACGEKRVLTEAKPRKTEEAEDALA